MEGIRITDKDYLLGLLGLEKKGAAGDWLLPALGFFGLGIVVGVTAVIVAGQTSLGDKVRGTIRKGIRQAEETYEHVRGAADGAASRAGIS